MLKTRCQEIVQDFHRVCGKIPKSFRNQFANCELEKRNFPISFPVNQEQTRNRPQIGTLEGISGEDGIRTGSQLSTLSRLSVAALPSVPETVKQELTLESLLKDCGKTSLYIKKRISIIVKTNLAEFDFTDPDLCVSFVEGNHNRSTKVVFTPAGYLTAILLLSNCLLGAPFRKKYLTFLVDSAVFVRKLDTLYRRRVASLERKNARLKRIADQAESITRDTNLVLNQTTHQTNLSFWSHMKVLIKAGGYSDPTFGRSYRQWNTNARLIHEIREACTREGLVSRLRRGGAWLYVDDHAKQYATGLFRRTQFE